MGGRVTASVDVNALVVEAYANRGVAVRQDGRLAPFHFPRKLVRPLPGDHIELSSDDRLLGIAPRRNEFGRGDPKGRFRPVAANLDQAVIVIAAEPAPSPDLLHRYLAAALIAGIRPIVVINKDDLPLPDQPPFNELDALDALGVVTVRTRCKPIIEIDRLETQLAGKTSLLAGQSGVGKTSLLNALIPDLDAQTGALSAVTGKGRHTTTSATLHPRPGQGAVIDSPGVWEYGLWAMPIEQLMLGFPDVQAHANDCRFRNCSHDHEPGCAVRAAVDSGKIHPGRYQAWRRLLAEQKRLGGLRGTLQR